MREEVLILSEADVRKLFFPEDAIAAAEDTFFHIGTGNITIGAMALMHTDQSQQNSFHAMPAILRHKGIAGVKWIDTFSNPLPGYPFSHGNIIVVSDIKTGSPLALVSGTSITAMRTAGGHGVVQAKYLANPEPEVLSVFGCGAQARAGIYGFLTQFPTLKQIRVFNRSISPVQSLAHELKERVEVVPCDSPTAAVKSSNLVLMASGAETTLLTMEMIRPGMTIIGIAGFRDMDPQIGKMVDKWYLGYKKPDQSILKAFNPGNILSNDDVFGDMTEVLAGMIPGREHEHEIIVSTHMGMGAHDVNCAFTVYLRAKERGVGQRFIL